MNTNNHYNEMKLRLPWNTWLAGLMICPFLLAGCASHKTGSAAGSGSIPTTDMTPVWQNAGATPPVAPAEPETSAPPPPNTLEPGITSVGGPVSTKPAYAEYDYGWPRMFTSAGSTNTLYEPQVVSWDGMVLQARAAVSVQAAGVADPTFGILQIKALTHVDKVERMVYFEDVQITDANFPSAAAKKAEYSAMWLALLKANVRSVALDRIEANLAVQGAEKKAQAVPVLNPAPTFIVSTTPAMLIQLQGQPVYRGVKGTGVERLLNTRALIGKIPTGALYLHLWDGYVTASSLSGPWAVASDMPKGLREAEKAAVAEKAVDLLGGQTNPDSGKPPSLKTTPLPSIYVATDPTELIVFEGPANWLPIPGTDLLYATNTVANVFKYLVDQQTYLLVSGRWFRAPSFSGPWSYLRGKELPKDFAQIPVTSPKENVLASVPGTPQAQQAIIENGIPQTAKVDRLATTMHAPVFDGAPQLKPIEGTSISYVANTATPIIVVAPTNCYALENGIWFVSTSANGPWMVAATVPADIYSIPPSSPLYYVTYVRVYSYNSAYVWTGYTPGYYGTVVDPDGLVVYGTGYYYTPWIDSIYIAPPMTYGYCASLAWTPWAGWGFGFASGWAWGASWGYWCGSPCAPYWGPYYGWSHGAYYNGYGGVTAWGPGGWAATTGNMYSHWGDWSATSRGGAGYNAYTGRGYAYQYGHAYNSVTGTIAAGERGAVQNVHNGNYAYGSRGAAYNPRTGVAAAGSRVTVGNANSGHQVTAGRGVVTGPDGKTTSVSGIKGQSGGVYDVGGHAFAVDDGNIYRPSTTGGWDKYNSSGGWENSQNLDQNRSLSSAYSSQDLGSQRVSSWENHGWQDSGSRGDRSGGGDGFSGFSRGGDGGGFGGFRGGGGGSRR
ncbi:MAG: autotransporter [Verrucomicrobiota bacterium]